MKTGLLAAALVLATGCSGGSDSSSAAGTATGSSSAAATTASASSTGASSTSSASASTSGTSSSSSSSASSSGSTGSTSSSASSSSAGSSTCASSSSTSASSSTGTSSSSGDASSSGGGGSTTGAPVTGDDCDHDPIALPVGADVSGSTVAAHDDFTAAASCFSYATGEGPDLVYAFTTPADGGGNYAFTLVPEASFDAAMYLVAGCVDGAESACLGGADLYGEGGTESFTALLAPGTSYALVVDGHGGESGGFTVRADYAGQPPTSDVCGAVVLDADAGAATAFGATEGAVNDYASPTCGGTGPDVFYGFSLAAEARVRATITPLDDGGDDYLSPVAVILGDCPFPDGGAVELGCGGPPTQFFEPAIADVPDLPAGDYVVVVDSAYDFFVGPYQLDLEMLPAVTAPANDGCAAPEVIALSTLSDGGSFGSAAVDTLGGADDLAPDPGGACGGGYATGADVVYAVDAPPGATHLTASFVSTRADLDPAIGEAVTAVIVRGGACAAGSELACATGASASTTVTGGTRYFVWVDQMDHQPTPQGTLQISFP